MAKKDNSGDQPLPLVMASILKALQANGLGARMTLEQIRAELGGDIGRQEELPRRIRDLRQYGYDVLYTKADRTYRLRSPEPTRRKANTDAIPSRLAARIRLIAHGRCQMCGKTISEDHIKLVVDHRVPRNWGGESNDPDNLWAICEPCNIAKQAFFATLPVSVMSKCMSPKQPIVRLGELLKAMEGQVVPRDLLEVVGRDDEWTRRLRELRDLGWKVTPVREKRTDGRKRYAYRLEVGTWRPWPGDIEGAIRTAALRRKTHH